MFNRKRGRSDSVRFLVRLQPKRGQGPTFLPLVRSLAESVMAEARNPKWTSYGALELDIFAPSKSDFELFLAAVEPLARLEFSKNLSEAPPHKSKQELIEEARGYFNAERYWEAHETLESVWRSATGEEKRYLQGVILGLRGLRPSSETGGTRLRSGFCDGPQSSCLTMSNPTTESRLST